MITTKTHTPGPWRPIKANARLSAAAPDLLAALEGLVRFVEYGLGSKCSIEVAKEAIAKAKGQVIDNSGCGIDPFEGTSR